MGKRKKIPRCCLGCGRTDDQVDLETAPCCNAKVCFDFCLFPLMPGIGSCPSCKKPLSLDIDEHSGEPSITTLDAAPDEQVRAFAAIFFEELDRDGWGDLDPEAFRALAENREEMDEELTNEVEAMRHVLSRVLARWKP